MDIKIFLDKSAEHITNQSKLLMTTMGEWELLDITAQKYDAGDVPEDSYIDKLVFHVSELRCITQQIKDLFIYLVKMFVCLFVLGVRR